MLHSISQERKYQLIGYVVVAVFVAPIFLYFVMFHGQLSSSSGDWSAFGSYFGGIYSVLISSFAAVVLYRQLRMQMDFQKHQFDRGQIERVEDRTERILQRMLSVTKENDVLGGGRRNGQNLNNAVRLISPKIGEGSDSQKQAESIEFVFGKYHDLLDLWLAFYRQLTGLDGVKETAYEQAKIGLLDQAHSFLGFQTCRALDIVIKNRREAEQPGGKFFFFTDKW
ncbi:hypothetical protein [Limnobacter litoralis]|uniref:DUF4760 domain-containing protein n=1 Tax=Limnobacter litoralis TaxID=481366 RepID=A0ABQ5YPH3_9BURK|nr:hypothetical protein [Limnobacter litoralis]GLR26493.1 hypothetical protein GCM10007875_15830 [Limnobacter litoralis]